MSINFGGSFFQSLQNQASQYSKDMANNNDTSKSEEYKNLTEQEVNMYSYGFDNLFDEFGITDMVKGDDDADETMAFLNDLALNTMNNLAGSETTKTEQNNKDVSSSNTQNKTSNLFSSIQEQIKEITARINQGLPNIWGQTIETIKDSFAEERPETLSVSNGSNFFVSGLEDIDSKTQEITSKVKEEMDNLLNDMNMESFSAKISGKDNNESDKNAQSSSFNIQSSNEKESPVSSLLDKLQESNKLFSSFEEIKEKTDSFIDKMKDSLDDHIEDIKGNMVDDVPQEPTAPASSELDIDPTTLPTSSADPMEEYESPFSSMFSSIKSKVENTVERIKDTLLDELKNVDLDDLSQGTTASNEVVGEPLPTEETKQTVEVQPEQISDEVLPEQKPETESSINDWIKSKLPKIDSSDNKFGFEFKDPFDLLKNLQEEDAPYENVEHLIPKSDTTVNAQTSKTEDSANKDVELTEQYEYMASEVTDTVLNKTGIVDFISVSDDTEDFVKELTLQVLKDNMTQEEIDEMNEKYGDALTESEMAEISKAWENLQENSQLKGILNSIPKWDEE